MGPPGLHLPGRDLPDLRLKINLLPLGVPKLSGTHENMGSHLERSNRYRAARESIDRTKKLSQLFWFKDRGKVPRLWSDKCTLQQVRGI